MRPFRKITLVVFALFAILFFNTFRAEGITAEGSELKADENAAGDVSLQVLSTDQPASSEKKIIIALDPGHGGSDPGAIANGLKEKDLNWAISLACKEELERSGRFEVVLTRSQEENPGLAERVQRGVDAGAHAFVSIHINSSESGKATGFEIWIPNEASYLYQQTHALSESLALSMSEHLSALGLYNRGIKTKDSTDGETYPDGSLADYFTVINEARKHGIPGLIVEHAFIDNEEDAAKLSDSEFLKRLGYADAAGIIEAYNTFFTWEQDNGRWKLRLPDGTYATNCWWQIDTEKYWFDSDSYMVTGWQFIDGEWYYFNGSGVMQTGWLNYQDARYYLGPSGAMAHDKWVYDSEGQCYLGSDGAMLVNTVTPDGYRVDANGHWIVGWIQDPDGWRYYLTEGSYKTGWFDWNGAFYYLDPETGIMATGWQPIGDDWYYLDSSGIMQTGWLNYHGTWYYLNSSGSMYRGWMLVGDVWYCFLDSGAMATGWQFVGNTRYYFDSSGVMVHDRWVYDSEGQCYLGSDGAMFVDTVTPDGYRVDANGRWIVGWAQDVDGWRFYLSEGGYKTGWLNYHDAWYYLEPSGIRVHDRWLSDNGGQYYLGSDGAMLVDTVTPDGYRVDANGRWILGWVQDPDGWRYYLTEGGYKTGWFDWNGARYYFDPETGIMQTGTMRQGNTVYHFDTSGKLLYTTVEEGAVDTAIMGTTLTTVNQMVSYYNAKGYSYPSDKYESKGAPHLTDFCQILLDQALSEGVRAEVLFAQVILETNGLQFGGDVDSDGRVQCNFGGLGATGNGEPGLTFPDVQTGLLAQTQHLKGYASTDPLNNECVDPRFEYLASKRGCAPTVDKLSGTWAGDPEYGNKLIRIMGELLEY